ncbi:hypothetical protein [Streptomyces sp. NPDC126503]|uniref:hypothetical protein n=1 Tax=Streptomyces sp. NPDC126503 TaxID=3155315 RepID=UPI003317BB04
MPDAVPRAVADAAAPAGRPRRAVRRGAGLIAVAAVLGLVGGTAVGYGVQVRREPAPLPPLNQLDLAHPAPLPKGQEPEPLTAAEDRMLRTQGDLRKLLLPRPAGAQAWGEDGWVPLAEYLSSYQSPARMMALQLEMGIRRVASRSWRSGGHRSVTVNLVQYRPGSANSAAEHVENQQAFTVGATPAASPGEGVKGSGNGRAYLLPLQREAGYQDWYEARAYVQRGDIAIEILISDTQKIAGSDIRSLAERQLERL